MVEVKNVAFNRTLARSLAGSTPLLDSEGPGPDANLSHRPAAPVHGRALLHRLAGIILSCMVFAVFAGQCPPVMAHNGPPFPIIQNREVGPYNLSVWADPNLGKQGGTYYVLLDPPKGAEIPTDTKVEVGVRPVSGRLPEVVYPAPFKELWSVKQYVAIADHDRQELWRIHIFVHSGRKTWATSSNVMVTPRGFGQGDLVFYFLPFLAVGFLWTKAFLRSRSRGLATGAASNARPSSAR